MTLTGTLRFSPFILALGGMLGCTWISFRLGQDLATVGFLYLVCVILTAVYGGFKQATVISLIAVACLDYFFDEPIFSLSVGRLSNWAELAAFVFTALVISRLSNQAHLRELEACAERRDASRLYTAAHRILLAGGPGYAVAALFREIFELHHVVVFDAVASTVHESGAAAAADREALAEQTRNVYFANLDLFEPSRRTWFCVLRLGGRPVGALALSGTDMNALTAAALASLCAIVVERERSLEQQNREQGARQAEQLRTAVLDSLAHKFKTPLTVIRTATSGLPAAGALSQLQTELVSLIDQEARNLNDLASRLVGAPALDASGFEPQMEPLLLSRLLKTAIQELELEKDRDRFRISRLAHEPPVLADGELILTALAQLIDNALKYSIPGSPIEIGFTLKETALVVSIRNRGLVVEPPERDRIFERFYRAPAAQASSTGTGLGLSIVKTIVADHRGHAWAVGEPDYGTALCLSLPIAPGVPQ